MGAKTFFSPNVHPLLTKSSTIVSNGALESKNLSGEIGGATKAPASTHTFTVGGAHVDVKGFTKEDFEKYALGSTHLIEQEISCIKQQADWSPREGLGMGEDMAEWNLAALALAQGKLRVSHFEICPHWTEPVDEHNGEDMYQYDYELEFEVAFA